MTKKKQNGQEIAENHLIRYELSKNKEDEITRGVFVDFGLNKKTKKRKYSEGTPFSRS